MESFNKCALVVGGSGGVGAAIGQQLLRMGYEKLYIADIKPPILSDNRINYIQVNLLKDDLSFLENLQDVNTLVITAGFGRLDFFDSFTPVEIENSFVVNAITPIKIIKHFYSRLRGNDPFYCAVMSSVAGMLSSPLYALYASVKAALCRFTESVNAELDYLKCPNRILNVAPGKILGTGFHGTSTDLEALKGLSCTIVDKMLGRERLFIPDYESVYQDVLKRYQTDGVEFGRQSIRYKLDGKLNTTPQIKVGYLSGTFDLFHIGHLNIINRAKGLCDYLVVGVHPDASHKGKKAFIPLQERMSIIKSLKGVNEVIVAPREDLDAYHLIKYDYLFVGSDYKGTERFNRYEEFFSDKSAEIIYFPYTDGTSSTKLRDLINDNL